MATARFLPLLLAGCLGLTSLGLSACRYNFVPLVPPEVSAKLPVRVVNAALKREGDTLRLSARIDGPFTPDYLRVYWYDGSRELGQDSMYLDAGERAAAFTLDAPKPGAYRAVLAFGGVVLRQLELTEVDP